MLKIFHYSYICNRFPFQFSARITRRSKFFLKNEGVPGLGLLLKILSFVYLFFNCLKRLNHSQREQTENSTLVAEKQLLNCPTFYKTNLKSTRHKTDLLIIKFSYKDSFVTVFFEVLKKFFLKSFKMVSMRKLISISGQDSENFFFHLSLFLFLMAEKLC